MLSHQYTNQPNIDTSPQENQTKHNNIIPIKSLQSNRINSFKPINPNINRNMINETRNYFHEIKTQNQAKLKEAFCKEKLDKYFWFFFYIISNIFNIINVIIYVVMTYTEKDQFKYAQSIIINDYFNKIDISFASYFSLEFLIIIIFYKNKHSNTPFIKRLFNWETFIDVITIAPAYILYFISDKEIRSHYRSIAVLRILRLYKSITLLQADSSMETYMNISKIKIQFILIIVIFISLFFIASGFMLMLQDLIPEAFNIKALTFMDVLFFIVVTTTTLGYGDMYPTHVVSRICVIILIVSFISVLSYQITQLIQLFTLIGGSRKFDIQNHVLLILDSKINIDLVLREIKRNNHRKEVVIITRDNDSLPSNEFPFNKVSMIHAEEIDHEILIRVNTKKADYIIVFCNTNFSNTEQSEKINEFVVFKIIQFYSDIPIYVQSMYNDQSFLCEVSKKKDDVFAQMKGLKSTNNNEGNDKVIKSIVPIFKIKSLIIGKAMFNPGFANFAQNLLFNDAKTQFDFEGFDIPMQAHFLGCENSIQISELPRTFVGLDFYDAMRLIYSQSIRDYLVKVNVKNAPDVNRPVLLIGIIDKSNKATERQIMFFPKNIVLNRRTFGVFITYDEHNYLEGILRKVQVQTKAVKDKEIKNENLLKNYTRIATRRMGFSENPSMNIVKRFCAQLSLDEKRATMKKGTSNSSIDEDGEIELGREKRDEKSKEKGKGKNDEEDDVDPNDNIIHEINMIVTGNPRKISFEEEEEDEDDDILVIDTSKRKRNRHSIITSKGNFNDVTDTNSITISSNNLIKSVAINSNTTTPETLINTKPKIGNKFAKYRSSVINFTSASEQSQPQPQPQPQPEPQSELKDNSQPSSSLPITSTLFNHIKKQSFLKSTKTFQTTDYDQHKIEKKISSNLLISNHHKHSINNPNQTDQLEKQILKENKEKDFNFFLTKKNQILTGRSEVNNQSTQRNILFIEAFNEESMDIFLSELGQIIQRRYQSENIIQSGFIVENRQFDCAKDDIGLILANHILIIGLQDGFDKLVQIIKLHYPYKDICLMTSYSVDDNIVLKYIKEHKNIYHIKGELDNPLHLINAGIAKATYVIFLVEQINDKANEDIGKILGFRALDYFFQTNLLLEIWDHQSVSFLGYNPVINQGRLSNELLHPLYMAGRILYLDHLSRIVCMSAKDTMRIEAWYELMNLGYKNKVTRTGEGTITLKKGFDGYPVIITHDLPEKYIGKEFFTVFTDLICQRNPTIVLGIYLENPLYYMKMKNEGTINITATAMMSQVNIMTSHKRKLTNMNAFNRNEQDYLYNLTLLKNISCNDRIVLDYNDLKHPFMPMFITNPPPWLVMTKGIKLLMMHYYEPPSQSNLSMFQKELANFGRRNRGSIHGKNNNDNSPMKNGNSNTNGNNRNYFGTGKNQKGKLQLGIRQESFFQTMAILKDKMKEKFKNAFRQLE